MFFSMKKNIWYIVFSYKYYVKHLKITSYDVSLVYLLCSKLMHKYCAWYLLHIIGLGVKIMEYSKTHSYILKFQNIGTYILATWYNIAILSHFVLRIFKKLYHMETSEPK